MIGDVLTSSTLFEAIKEHYPNSELHYLINTHTYPVVEGNPFIDEFHFFTPEHEKSKRKLFRLANELRKKNYDVIIDIYSKISSNIISFKSKAKTKISKYKYYTAFIYSHTYKDKKIAKTNAGLAIENRMQLLEPLNIETSKIVRPKIFLTDSEKTKAKHFLEAHHLDLGKPIFMIGVLGSGINKTYPFEYMAKIIDCIVNKHPKSQILFNYIPKQVEDAKAIFNLCLPITQKQIYFDVFGKSLRDFLALTSHCDALIGNEGGAINMAKALFIPTFTIFSPWIEKEAWNLFDDDKSYTSIHLRDLNPEVYLGKTLKQMKKKSSDLYSAFSPDLIIPKLKDYLQQFNP